jgi:hypothetical protein
LTELFPLQLTQASTQVANAAQARFLISTWVGHPKKPPTSPKIFHKLKGKHCFLGTCEGLFWLTNPSGHLPVLTLAGNAIDDGDANDDDEHDAAGAMFCSLQ